MKTKILLGLLLFGLAGVVFATLEPSELDNRIRTLTAKLEAFQARPDGGVPAEALRQAQGIILFGGTKAGFLFAYQGGGGVAMVRGAKSGEWSPVAFVGAKQPSLGLQAGGEQNFYIILLMTTNANKMLVDPKFQLASEARGTAGDSSGGVENKLPPVVEQSVLIYDDSKGFFGGADIKAGTLMADDEDNRVYYGQYLGMTDILFDHKVQPSASAVELAKKINWYPRTVAAPKPRKNKKVIMKTAATLLTAPMLALAGSLCLGVFAARADLEVSAGVEVHAAADFEAPLIPLGSWVQVHSYGRCWRPSGVAVGWRPYCEGQWEWTDAGWYWASDEPWAWACYHYGNWIDDPALGWIWVPGVEWAPAWVYWRVSDRHIGWAPCPPRGLPVAPALFAFVDIGRFHDHIRPSGVILRNESIIRETREITQVRRETRNIDGRMQRIVVNTGPDVAVVQRAAHTTLTPRPIVEVDRQTHYPAALMHRAPEPPVRDRAVPVPHDKPVPVPGDRPIPVPEVNRSVPELPAPIDKRPPPVRVNPVPAPSIPAVEPPHERHDSPGEPPRGRPEGKEREKP